VCIPSTVFLLIIISLICFWTLRSGSKKPYDQSRAIQFANLAGAAYCSADDLRQWNCGSKCIAGVDSVQVCTGETTKAFVGLWDSMCIVSFMGTQEYSAMITDLEIYKSVVRWNGCENCQVHSGFLKEWYSLQTCVQESLVKNDCTQGSSIRVTGHSLGAALSSLAMMSLSLSGWQIEEAYNFGMPRTGDQNFSKEFGNLFHDVFFRVTHHQDPVVQVPPNKLVFEWHFQHVEPEVFYDGKIDVGFSSCEQDGDEHCSAKYWNIAADMGYIGDHMEYMDLQIGSVSCRTRPMQSKLPHGSLHNESFV